MLIPTLPTFQGFLLFPLMLHRHVLVFFCLVSHGVICSLSHASIQKLFRKVSSYALVSQFNHEIQDSWITAGKVPEFF